MPRSAGWTAVHIVAFVPCLDKLLGTDASGDPVGPVGEEHRCRGQGMQRQLAVVVAHASRCLDEQGLDLICLGDGLHVVRFFCHGKSPLVFKSFSVLFSTISRHCHVDAVLVQAQATLRE